MHAVRNRGAVCGQRKEQCTYLIHPIISAAVAQATAPRPIASAEVHTSVRT